MAHLHLPEDHDERDRATAAALARVLGSGELFVAWRDGAGGARPVVPCQEQPRRRRRGLRRLFRRAA